MTAPIGVALVGHGRTASELLAAAHGIVGPAALTQVVAIDCGAGDTPELGPRVCNAIAGVDAGAGVLVLVDLLGASPWQCAQREASGHEVVVLGGLNLAMLLKLAAMDRGSQTLEGLAAACADSGRRAVVVAPPPPNSRAVADEKGVEG